MLMNNVNNNREEQPSEVSMSKRRFEMGYMLLKCSETSLQRPLFVPRKIGRSELRPLSRGFVFASTKYYSATDSETTNFGRFYTGKGCQAMSHMSAFPEFFVRSRSVKCKHNPSILHFPAILRKITPPGARAKVRRVSESVAKQYKP
ncbi:hypothetical protein AVEN_109024-1 [Araneus ventricosus]|uniref:Uncharacterized protein n=1 Tax=Araneus ventricosus TaxID=182803 RepID=A0A4Y2HML0_ARAVE|nr:hypothetical protein AVEN_109024-1 [Araneus ventricosus]